MFVKEKFIGREEIVKLISKRLCDLKEGYRQNIALLGDELLGKTHIIKYIFESNYDPDIIPLYFDLSQPATQVFPQRFLNTILFSFLKTKEITLPRENFSRLIEESQHLIPTTTSKIQEISAALNKGRLDTTTFREMLQLPEMLHQETQQKIVIILDEFQNLESLKIRNAFQELGKTIMTQKSTMYIVTSSHKAKAKKIVQDELSLLFGNFETIDVQHFDNKTSSILIKNRLKNTIMPQETANFLINFTGGHPFYLDKITEHIYQSAILLESNTITPFVFIYSLEGILFNDWGVLNLRFNKYIDVLASKNKTDIIQMLLLIAQGKNRLKDLSSILHKSYQDINQKLSKLIDTGILWRSGSFFNINDRVFGFWLKFVYLEKLNNLSQNYEDQVISFRKKIEQSLFEFIETSKKDIAQRLYELFTSFSNESVKIGQNKITLSKFKEIESLNLNGFYIKNVFLCHCDQGEWLIAFKNGDITEESVCEFIDKTGPFQTKDKQARRLIIGIDKTEVNARLLAQEAKIATWNIDHLNMLLDLYGKPRLIV
ncbi:ATP-binding protein [Thermoproteota archaeon]